MNIDKETYQHFYVKAATYCSVAEHCESEVMDKLKAWETPEEIVDTILNQLKEEEFINEIRYCNAFVADKLKHNKWGRIKIAYELGRKRLSGTCIQDILQNIDEEDYRAMACELMTKKNKEVKAKDTYERRNKLFRFMAGRGFEFDVMESAYAEMMKE